MDSLAVVPTALELATLAVEREHAAQKPAELSALIEWLSFDNPPPAGLNPRVVLEVGCFKGGTLWLWRRLWPQARILAVDDFSLEPCSDCAHRRAHRDCPHRRIERALGVWPRGRLLVGDSHAESSRAALTAWSGGGVDFLFVDGDHSAAGVRRDVELYWPLVRPGGAMVLHDVAGEAFPGVVELWRELEREPGAFLILEDRPDWGGLGVVPR